RTPPGSSPAAGWCARSPARAGSCAASTGSSRRPARSVLPDDHALDAGNHPDAGDHAGADGEPCPPRGQRRQLQERAVGVDEQLYAFPDPQPAPVAVPLLIALAATRDGQLELLTQLVED